MGDIIKFPKSNAKIKTVKNRLRSLNYHNYAILGLGVTFLFALGLNISFQNLNGKNRDLANYNGGTDSLGLDDYILKSLNSSDNNTEIVFSKKPDQEDKLIFETLVGSYDTVKVDGRIAQIYLKPGYDALKISMLPMFLTQYRKAIGMEQLDFRLTSQRGAASEKETDQSLSYELLTGDSIVGHLSVKLDENNQIISMHSKFISK